MRTGNGRVGGRASALARGSALVLLAALVALLGPAGCGYHLRGAGVDLSELPPILIQGGKADGVKPQLRRILTTSGVRQVEDPGEAGFMIRIEGEQLRQVAISVATDAKIREYELVYSVTYDVLDPASGEAVQPTRSFVLRRIYSYDDTEILGKEEEREQLEESMLSNAARRILRDLYTAEIRRHKPAVGTEPVDPAGRDDGARTTPAAPGG